MVRSSILRFIFRCTLFDAKLKVITYRVCDFFQEFSFVCTAARTSAGHKSTRSRNTRRLTSSTTRTRFTVTTPSSYGGKVCIWGNLSVMTPSSCGGKVCIWGNMSVMTPSSYGGKVCIWGNMSVMTPSSCGGKVCI